MIPRYFIYSLQGRNSWGGGGDSPPPPPQCLQMQFCRATCMFKARAICWAKLPCFTVGKQRKNRIAEFED